MKRLSHPAKRLAFALCASLIPALGPEGDASAGVSPASFFQVNAAPQGFGPAVSALAQWGASGDEARAVFTKVDDNLMLDLRKAEPTGLALDYMFSGLQLPERYSSEAGQELFLQDLAQIRDRDQDTQKELVRLISNSRRKTAPLVEEQMGELRKAVDSGEVDKDELTQFLPRIRTIGFFGSSKFERAAVDHAAASYRVEKVRAAALELARNSLGTEVDPAIAADLASGSFNPLDYRDAAQLALRDRYNAEKTARDSLLPEAMPPADKTRHRQSTLEWRLEYAKAGLAEAQTDLGLSIGRANAEGFIWITRAAYKGDYRAHQLLGIPRTGGALDTDVNFWRPHYSMSVLGAAISAWVSRHLVAGHLASGTLTPEALLGGEQVAASWLARYLVAAQRALQARTGAASAEPAPAPVAK